MDRGRGVAIVVIVLITLGTSVFIISKAMERIEARICVLEGGKPNGRQCDYPAKDNTK